MREHVKEVHKECDCEPICRGGLFVCTVCNAAEGTLTTECPGYRVKAEVQDQVMAGALDFCGGEWVRLKERSDA